VRRWCATALRAGDLDPDLSARLHARLAQALMYAGELAAADQMSRRAIGADRASIAALQARQLVRSGPDGVAERSGLARDLLAAAGSASDLPAELSGHLWQLDGAFETGDLAAATSALRAAADTAAPLSGPIPRWLIVRGRAALRQAQGRYREALQLADDAHRLLARTGHPGADGARLGLRAAVGRHLGHEPGEAGTTAALEPFQPLVDDHDDDPSGFLLLARVVGASAHAEAGRLQEAARYLDSAGPVAGWHVPPYLHLGVWAGAVPALVGLHRRADLNIVRQRLRPYAGGFVASGAGTTFFLGPVDLHLGIAERALGQSRPAAQSLREACRLAAAAGLPGFLAEAQLELGVTLLGSSSTADHRRARDLLTSAGDGAARLGMTAVRRRVEQARAAASPLTARERNVASLVADGLTNRQIAEKLVVSERTAENHVQHILGKLGLTNRVQVAGWWREQRG
jgi:DNA-binding CsgD family transcriptional regulator